ncbi:MAG: VCBS repeat-containing protein, partial [Planctomycetes bacterium]|nr:VCBS repeat-containing protein [Planctomycetota bacterium]
NDGQPCLGDGDCLGGFDGTNFPSHQVARVCIPDKDGNCTVLSEPNQAFANLVGTGNPGDWTDLHPAFGQNYDVALSFTGQAPDDFDCSQFVGGCCLFDGSCTDASHPFECIAAATTYAGDGVDCLAADCQPLCQFTTPGNPGGAPCGQPDTGPCAFGNGSPGCDDPICCCTVCETMPECCLFEWTTACAVQATTVLNCAPEPGQPSDLATGPDETADGYLRIGTDDFGSWALPGFGGALGAFFNPVGKDEGLQTPDFAQHFSVYRQADGEGESLTTNPELDDLCTNNNSMTRGITTLSVSTDTNNTRGVVLGDVDGDGDLDVVFANFGEKNRVCLGDGNGGFVCTDLSSDTSSTIGVALGDV